MIDTASFLSGLVGVFVGALLNYWLQSRSQKLARKLDVLRRLSANRHILTEKVLRIHTQPIGEPFCALNEAPVVFADNQNVTEALRCMQENPGQTSENILRVIRAMHAACGRSLSQDHESLIERPFTPGDLPPGA